MKWTKWTNNTYILFRKFLLIWHHVQKYASSMVYIHFTIKAASYYVYRINPSKAPPPPASMRGYCSKK